jgi:hypothetical protein
VPADDPARPSLERSVRLDDRVIGTVWLERPGGDGPLDEMVAERMAVAAGALWPAAPVTGTPADPALVELVLSPSADLADRSRGVRLLGFDPHVPIRAIATVSAGVPEPVRTLGTRPGCTVRTAVIGARGAVLVQARDEDGLRAVPTAPRPGAGSPPPEAHAGVNGSSQSSDARPGVDGLSLPADVRLGIGSPCLPPDLATSWQQALTALRFAGVPGWGPAVRFESLGALAVLASVSPEVADADPDVRTLRDLAGTSAGAADLAVLAAYCAAGSLRQAAEALHLHHSSVARRVHNLGRRLGLDLERPEHRLRAEVALILAGLATA